MNAFNSEKPRRFPALHDSPDHHRRRACGGGYFLAPRFERSAPQITLTPDSDVLGLAPVEIVVTDQGAGLKSVTATLSVGGTEHSLASEQYAEPVKEKKLTVAVAKIAGIKEGPAVLRITARDASLWGFFKGNETVVEKNLTIDITPPTLELIADDRYINFGGVGAIVYKPSRRHGDERREDRRLLLPRLQGPIKDQPDHFLALFAHPYNVPREHQGRARRHRQGGQHARDAARLRAEERQVQEEHHRARPTASCRTRWRRWSKDADARQGSPKDVFVAVNKRLRKENEDKIAAITQQGHAHDPVEGRVRQLSNSKVEANFADQRTYTYNRRADRHRVSPRLRPVGHQALSGRSREQRHGGLHRRPRHLRQYGDPRPRPRALHALWPPELDRRQGRRFGQASGRSSARPARPASPAATICTTASTWTASRCCRWSGGTRSGSTTTSSPSWRAGAEKRSPRRRRQPRASRRASAAASAIAAY